MAASIAAIGVLIFALLSDKMADPDSSHVAVKIKSMLSGAQPFYPAECCIYRVPLQIRNLNPDAYTPKVVSMGPFHYGDVEEGRGQLGDTTLQKMEGHKQIYCQEFIKRSEASLDKLVTRVQELEPQVRRCYSDEIKLSKEKFVNVILVDSGFVLELFWRSKFYTQAAYGDDAVMSTPWLSTRIILDLLLLENQLPFFVFKELYELAFPSCLFDDDDHPSFLRLSSHCFASLVPDFSHVANTGSNIAHFTDLLRTSYLQASDKRPSREAEVNQLYSATELHEAGVKFMVNKASNCLLLDLDFSGRTLTIPQIKVDDWTEIMLRNMMALEQCHCPDASYITDYVGVLDFLINTDKDVDFLVKKGIIVNWLGDSNEVAELFNGLMKNITESLINTEYFDICEKLNAYYNHPFHSRMATLRRDYCNTPWKTVASIAGIILLILTVVQAACSILQVK